MRHLMEVVDELGEVLNGVDVMVRRRGDQGHSRLAAPQVGDVGAHLLGRQLPTLTCATKAPRCQLLNLSILLFKGGSACTSQAYHE